MTNKIEYPKLNKIGGFRSFAQKTFFKIIIIVLISSLTGGLSGYIVQKSFRDLTGYNKSEEAITEVQSIEMQKIIESRGNIETISNPFLRAIAKSLNSTSYALRVMIESDLMQKANRTSWNIIFFALKPILIFLDFFTFWVPFILMFILSAWLSNKLIYSKRYILTNGTDPEVIKNIEILENKVKELVDNANTNNK